MHIPYIPNIRSRQSNIWLRALCEAMPEHNIRFLEDFTASEKQQCKVAIVANPKHDEMLQLPNLKWLHSTWAGVEQLLLNDALKNTSVVRLQDPALAEHMAKSVLSWVLNVQLNLPTYLQQQSHKIWQSFDVIANQNLNITILGAGNMALASAKLLRSQGYTVRLWGRSPKLDVENYYFGSEQLQSVVESADIVVVLLPSAPGTRNLINQGFLNWLKMECVLINFARGDIVESNSLLQALNSNRLHHAVLDVFPVEPLPQDDIFWEHPKVTVLPHAAAPTSPQSASRIIAKNIANYCKNGTIPQTVDRERGY